ncbi:BRO-N domain-containing protein [Novosphingobium nitrogenifigens]|uniref:BRO-N domain-containing protein n=1 Tax=Novosphingobium nitrogenifigens TaxID=378548 RepID=UPI000376DFEB|nr:BRO family protein [Novosphingobium nitrogenifigens]
MTCQPDKGCAPGSPEGNLWGLPVVATTNGTTATIRTALIDNEPWFVAVDVCRALGMAINIPATYANRGFFSDEEYRLLQREDLTRCEGLVETLDPRVFRLGLLSESGLYKLIMRSDKKEALEFQHWIASEVLPSIRKTGKYALALPVRTRQIRPESQCSLSAGYVASRLDRRSTGFLGPFRDAGVACV